MLVVRAGLVVRAVDLLRQRAVEDVVHQRRFAAARNAGDHGERAQRNLDVDVLQIVLARARDHQTFLPLPGAPHAGSAILRCPTDSGRSANRVPA